jgi:hypothetical protein
VRNEIRAPLRFAPGLVGGAVSACRWKGLRDGGGGSRVVAGE